jgi:hypothetical protein
MKLPAKQIAITVEVGTDHDWCKIRRLLKALLRSYGLKCVSVEPAKPTEEPSK